MAAPENRLSTKLYRHYDLAIIFGSNGPGNRAGLRRMISVRRQQVSKLFQILLHVGFGVSVTSFRLSGAGLRFRV